MKYSKTVKFLELKLLIEEYKDCFLDGLNTVTINPDLSISVNGDLLFENKNFKQFPFILKNVSGNFAVAGCRNLISFEGCPEGVERLYVSDCQELKEFKFFPKHIETYITIEKKMLTDVNIQTIGNNLENCNDVLISGFEWDENYYNYYNHNYKLVRNSFDELFELYEI